jgi:ATP-dependent Lon protease
MANRRRLYSRSGELVGDRNPREHEFSVQLRAFDASKSGRSLGVAAADRNTWMDTTIE